MATAQEHQEQEELKFNNQNYYMAFLKKGPNCNQDKDKANEIQTAHLAHIQKLADKGKLVLAGPFMDDWDVRGIFVFDVETEEEARALAEQDPAVKAGRLILEFHPWYGPVDLKKVSSISNE